MGFEKGAVMRFQRELEENIARCREEFVPSERSFEAIMERVPDSIPVRAAGRKRPGHFTRFVAAAACLCTVVAVTLVAVFSLAVLQPNHMVSANSISHPVDEASVLQAIAPLSQAVCPPDGIVMKYAESVWEGRTVSVGMSGMPAKGEFLRIDFVLDGSYSHGDEYVYDQAGNKKGNAENYRVKELEDNLYEYEYIAFERFGIAVYAQYKRMKSIGEGQGKEVFLEWVSRLAA